MHRALFEVCLSGFCVFRDGEVGGVVAIQAI
jgi:hypothetical protein